MLLFRGMHFILRRFAALDNRIWNKMQQQEKMAAEKQADDFSLSLPAKDPFFAEISIITHAGGGLQGLSYLNSKDAFSQYYKNGNRVFEYDIDLSSDGRFICAHTDERITEKEHLAKKIDGRFTPILIEECVALIKDHKDIKVIFDCKFTDLKPFAEYIKSKLTVVDGLSRIVIQVFNEENIKQIKSVWDFHMLYVCMNNTDYLEAARLCVEYKIPAVSISYGAIKDRSRWQVFKKANICSFAYTVNTVQEYKDLKDKGIDGVFSDFLFKKDVDSL